MWEENFGIEKLKMKSRRTEEWKNVEVFKKVKGGERE